MAVVALSSAKGSPGVSTLAVLLGATWHRRALVVEADPSGGVLASRYRIGVEPGLMSLATAARRGMNPQQAPEHAQPVSEHLGLICAPVAGSQTASVLLHGGPRLSRLLAAAPDTDVFIDAGRWWPGSAATDFCRAADVWLWVCRPRPDEVFGLMEPIAQERARTNVGLITVGQGPWPPKEAATLLDVSLLGSVRDEPRAAASLSGDAGSERALRRSMWWRSGAVLARELAGRLPLIDVGPIGQESAGWQ
jgi:hypothetical protein